MRSCVVHWSIPGAAAGRRSLVAGCLALCWTLSPLAAAEEATVSGSLVANGETIELPYVYLWAEEEGFYDPGDPTWTLLFVERPVEQRELGEPVWDAAWIEIGITETSEFGDQPELQVYSQSLKLAADSGGNITGGADNTSCPITGSAAIRQPNPASRGGSENPRNPVLATCLGSSVGRPATRRGKVGSR